MNLNNKWMSLFDVQSFFRYILLLETGKYVYELLRQLDVLKNLPKDLLTEVFLRGSLNVQFTFNATDGVAMESALGPPLADVFMTTLEHSSVRPHIN